MAVTPILKKLRMDGGTFYTFQPAMKDLTLMFGNDNNIKFNFSKFVCLKLPNWEQVTRQSMYIDPNELESLNDNSTLDDTNTFFVKAYLQNYAENLNTIFDSNRNDNNFSNTAELSLIKSLSNKKYNSTPPMEFVQTGTFLDVDNTTRNIYKEKQNGVDYEQVIQYIGDINMINNTKLNGDEYVEVYGHIPTGAGKITDVQFVQNLMIQPNQAQIPLESGEDWIVGQQNNFENSTDKTYAKALYDTNDRKFNVSTDKDLLKIDWNDLERPESKIKFDNGDFEFNAVLVYYDIFDKNNESTVSRNLYGIWILDSFDLSSPNVSKINTFKKYQPNENQSGNGFNFRFNLMFSNSSNVVTTTNVIGENSTLSMELYMEALEVLKRIGYNSDEIIKTAFGVNSRLNKMETILLSIELNSGQKDAQEAVKKINDLLETISPKLDGIDESLSKLDGIDESLSKLSEIDDAILASQTATTDLTNSFNTKIGEIDDVILASQTTINNLTDNVDNKIGEIDDVILASQTATTEANNTISNIINKLVGVRDESLTITQTSTELNIKYPNSTVGDKYFSITNNIKYIKISETEWISEISTMELV